MMKRSLSLLSLVVLVMPSRGAPPASEGIEFFEKRIRPLLVDNCYQCHTAKKIRGGLILDSKTAFLKGGDNGPAFVAGQPEKSRLIHAVRYTDADLRMPPKGKLNDQQINDLVEWVKRGAPMPDDKAPVVGPGEFDFEKRRQHWAFQPIKITAIPNVRYAAWVRNPIDAFILAGLEKKGLKPARETDRRTLIRRLTFDLLGLPPTPREVEAFLKDDAPDAMEKLVDRLLASPAYGERWGRHWLDLVRYAETQGHEFDFDLPFAYQYRDYVVRALNADLPYDQFVTEHVAGDLLPKPRRHANLGFNESVIGTGFFFLGESKHSPVDVRAEGAERSDNQIDVLTKTFLGLTVSCARCHDHKFDPIWTKDYYALAGYLRSSRYQHADINPPELSQPILKQMQQNLEKAQAIAIEVASQRLKNALAKLTTEERHRFLSAWPEFTGLRPEVKDAFAERRRGQSQRLKNEPPEKHVVFADFMGEGLSDWRATGDAFGDRANKPVDAVLRFNQPLVVDRLLGPGGISSGRLGVRTHGALRSPSFTISKKYILFRVAGAGTRINVIIDGFQQIRDPIYGRLGFGIGHGEEYRWHVIDVGMWIGHRAYIDCLDESDGYMMMDRVVFSDSPSHPREPANSLLVNLLDDETLDTAEKFDGKLHELLQETLTQWSQSKLDSRDRVSLINRMLKSTLLQQKSEPVADEQSKRQKIKELLEERAIQESTLPRPTYVMAMTDGTGENERVFIRGNHKTLGDEAPRGLLLALADGEQPAPKQGSGRLELARRMTNPSNALLSRVMVNRLWHHHFGTGIVRSPDDFGHQGQLPTHPELLDWLANEFVKRGWSLKQMHRLMVTSSLYRMASQSDTATEEADPENKLWHRMPVRRLEAEAIRDAILSVSGRLNQRIGGPGTMPHLTEHMQGRGRPGHSGPIDGDGRRSLYVNVRRNFLSPLFLAFDYPMPFTTIGRRSVSNVPAQALSMMNNPFVKQQAELWAKRILEKPGLSPKDRIALLYETAFSRPPSAEETAAALEFLQEQGAKDDVKTWAELCHVLFNVKEFIFLN